MQSLPSSSIPLNITLHLTLCPIEGVGGPPSKPSQMLFPVPRNAPHPRPNTPLLLSIKELPSYPWPLSLVYSALSEKTSMLCDMD